MRTYRDMLFFAVGMLSSLVIVGCSMPAPADAPIPVDAATEPMPSRQRTDAEERVTVTSRPERMPAMPPPETGDKAGQLPLTPARLAVRDLAQKMDMDAEDIVIMEIRNLQLPADGLGCPGGPVIEGPDVLATGQVEGQEIVLAAAGREYKYRAHGWQIVLCSPGRAFSDLAIPPLEGQLNAPVDAAKAALGSELGVTPQDIEVMDVEAVEWPDASLGCPQEGMLYAQVVTPGYRILLKAEGKVFEYHSDRHHVVLCQPD